MNCMVSKLLCSGIVFHVFKDRIIREGGPFFVVKPIFLYQTVFLLL